MVYLVNRAFKILESRGLAALIASIPRYLFQSIRPYTPRVKTEYNDVTVEKHHIIDDMSPYHDRIENRPQYEGAIVEQTKLHVSPGDTVVILGGGVGVTTVHAAKLAGAKGEVHVYEGAKEMAKLHSRTLDLNPVDASVDLTQAIVGEAGELWGTSDESQRIKPGLLPEADIYIIDIEGAEAKVVPKLEPTDTIIVETHGNLGSSTEEMSEFLENKGYTINVVGVAEPSMRERHEDDDVMVVVAQKRLHSL